VKVKQLCDKKIFQFSIGDHFVVALGLPRPSQENISPSVVSSEISEKQKMTAQTQRQAVTERRLSTKDGMPSSTQLSIKQSCGQEVLNEMIVLQREVRELRI
jgi:hypothetical protein